MVKIAETFQDYRRLYEGTKAVFDEVVTRATPLELRWQKGTQFLRAMGKADKGEATPTDLAYLYRKGGLIYPGTKRALKAEVFLGPIEPDKIT